jgi:hypothetical protein
MTFIQCLMKICQLVQKLSGVNRNTYMVPYVVLSEDLNHSEDVNMLRSKLRFGW